MHRLADSLPFLLARAGERMGALFARELAEHGLTLPAYRVLAALREQPDQRLAELAGMTGAELSTLSRLIAAMQRRRLLTRRRPADDQRSLSIRLTAEGEATARQLAPRAAYYERLASGDLAAAELVEFKRQLRRIQANLERLEANAAPATSHATARQPRL